jgi:hypothetical protein
LSSIIRTTSGQICYNDNNAEALFCFALKSSREKFPKAEIGITCIASSKQTFDECLARICFKGGFADKATKPKCEACGRLIDHAPEDLNSKSGYWTKAMYPFSVDRCEQTSSIQEHTECSHWSH